MTAWYLTVSLYSTSESISLASLIQRHSASLIERTTDEQRDIGEAATILSVRRNSIRTTFLRAGSRESSAGYILTSHSFARENGSGENGSVSFNSTQEIMA